MAWIVSSVQISRASAFLRSSSRAFSKLANSPSTLRWSSLIRATASGFVRRGMQYLPGLDCHATTPPARSSLVTSLTEALIAPLDHIVAATDQAAAVQTGANDAPG